MQPCNVTGTVCDLPQEVSCRMSRLRVTCGEDTADNQNLLGFNGRSDSRLINFQLEWKGLSLGGRRRFLLCCSLRY